VVQCPVSGNEHIAGVSLEAAHPVANGTVMPFRSGWLASDGGETPVALASSRCEQLPEHRRFLASTDRQDEGSRKLVLSTSAGRVLAAMPKVAGEELDADSLLLRHTPGTNAAAISVLPQEGCDSPVLLILDKGKATLQAVQSGVGEMLGEWALPRSVTWHGLCAATHSMYVMGREEHGKKGARAVIWRYPIPKALANRTLLHSGNSNWLGTSVKM